MRKASDEEADAAFDALTEKEILWETYLVNAAAATSVRTIEIVVIAWAVLTLLGGLLALLAAAN